MQSWMQSWNWAAVGEVQTGRSHGTDLTRHGLAAIYRCIHGGPSSTSLCVEQYDARTGAKSVDVHVFCDGYIAMGI
jgi:hypothetical protein